MKRLIVNGDDFGLCEGVSRGILQAWRDGILTSATMLTNMPGFSSSAAVARENPDFPLGVHLNVLWGEPVSSPSKVASLLDSNGEFLRSPFRFAMRRFSGRIRDEDLRREFEAQISRFMDAGFSPTHLDTHKHIHALPGVLKVMIESGRRFGIRRIRYPLERRLWRTMGRNPSSWAKRIVISAGASCGAGELRRADVRTTDDFSGVDPVTCATASRLRAFLRDLPDGTTELVCHPGVDDDVSTRYSLHPPDRRAELTALLDQSVMDTVKECGILLICFREL